jgi:hypothetical protein
MNTQDFTTHDRRAYVLAEFRCALIKAKLAQYDIEAVALALKIRLVTAEQAVEMFWDSTAIHFLGIDLGSQLDLSVDTTHQVEPNQEVPT